MNENKVTLAEQNIEIHIPEGLGGWRRLYVEFLNKFRPTSIVEVGSGSPEFLQSVSYCSRRTAIDGGDRWKNQFIESGIEFCQMDLDKDEYLALEPYDVSVCSDVFEHLLFPERTLEFLHRITRKDGFLMAHVPNDYTWSKTVKVLLGTRQAKMSHPHCEEYNNPHLRRFTKMGFEQFLKTKFEHNLFISDIRYSRLANIIKKCGLRVPYGIEGGPTFLSTNSKETFDRLREIKKVVSYPSN